MGLLDIILGRTKPVPPDLDRLFGLPSAAVTLEVAAGFTPTGTGAVCFATVEGAAFEQTHREIEELLDADAGRQGSPGASEAGNAAGSPVELVRDEYGYSWLVSRRSPEQLSELVTDLHAVNTSLESNGFGPQLLCSLVSFRGEADRRLALVYLYKRGTFYPLCTQPGRHKRDNAFELQVASLLENDLRIEKDLNRWFPLWDAPGMVG
ncbi:hypothetical protein [Streptomyces sp. NPDC020996]|uniref:PspA-associated protein PspAB n=1 Tax=Streptomyces sp. NPDC020996 TaxID=3154791 RepID=UPI0033E0BD47